MKVAENLVAVITSLVGDLTLLFGFLWYLISSFGVVVDLVFIGLLMFPDYFLDNWNPISSTYSPGFSDISLTLSIPV